MFNNIVTAVSTTASSAAKTVVNFANAHPVLTATVVVTIPATVVAAMLISPAIEEHLESLEEE